MFRRNLAFLEKLVIVESPNKVIKVEDLLSNPKVIPDWSFQKEELKKISKGPEKVTALATTGHFMFLKELTWRPLAIKGTVPEEEEFPSNGVLSSYSLEWEVLPGRRIQEAVSRYLTELGDNITEIIIATDPDREGELIAVHTLNLIQQMYPDKNFPFSRAYMHSITEEGITTAMANRSLQFDHNLANAAEARHAMDRIFGFLGSSVVRYANPQMRSIGRVQTPALILVNEREEKIAKYMETHKSTFEIKAICQFTSKSGSTHSQTVVITPRKGDDIDWEDEKEVERASLQWKLNTTRNFRCNGSPTRQTGVSEPPEPFTMATLIAKANRQLHLTSETVSSSLQDLFQMGYITYPRTDSSRVDESVLPSIYEAVKTEYGKNMVYRLQDRENAKKPKKEKRKTEEGNVEDAHEAIRPTDMSLKADKLGHVADNTKQVYDLIRRHTLAAFMIPMKTERITAVIDFTSGSGKELSFTLQGKHATEPGWSLAYRTKGNSTVVTDTDAEDIENGVEVVQTVSGEEFKAIAEYERRGIEEGDRLPQRYSNHGAQALSPLAYSEGGLIQELKANGVGRPSTYPMIVKTLLARNYITVEEGRCKTTEVGRLLVETSTTTFPSIVDINFTSSFEKKLDRIAKPEDKTFLSKYKNLTEADLVLSVFMSTFLNYVTEATRQQRASIVERSMTLKQEQKREKGQGEDEEVFEEKVEREREKIMEQVPELVEFIKSYRTFTALQNSLTDYLRRHFPPSPVTSRVSGYTPRPFKRKSKKGGRFK